MKLKKVDAVKYGLITGVSLALLSFILLVIMFLFTSMIGLGASSDSLGLGALFGGGVIMIILGPIMYFIFGFVFGWLGTIILNFVLKKTGGLDIEFEKSDLGISEIGKE